MGKRYQISSKGMSGVTAPPVPRWMPDAVATLAIEDGRVGDSVPTDDEPVQCQDMTEFVGARVVGWKRNIEVCPRGADTTRIFQHRERRTYHWGNLFSEAQVGCGKAKSTHHKEVPWEDMPKAPWPLCDNCFPLERQGA